MAIIITPFPSPTLYNSSDVVLLNPIITQSTFNPSENYIEYTIKATNGSFSITDYNYNRYSFPSSGITSNNIENINIDPGSDITSKGYVGGEFNVYYNFLKNELGTSFSNQLFFIKEISSDRTEVTLGYILDNTSLPSDIDIFKSQLNSNPDFFQDFYLNFGDDNLFVANNIAIDNATSNVLINLYDALPPDIQVKDTLWIVTQIANTLAFNINITPDIVVPTVTTFPLQGPNLNIPILDQINNSTGFQTYNTLLTSSLLSTSYSQLNNLISSSGIEINIDYTDFSNFIHFSSAVTRINNFYYKKQLIDQYQQEIDILNNITSLTTTSNITLLTNQINNIIENFDGYEYFLYYGTGSWSYPKSDTTIPYTLYPAGTPEVLTWLGDAENLTGILGSASLYDRNNLDYLYNTVPNFIQEDNQNLPYQTFIDMVAQHYDNIWVYYKDVTNRYNTDNRLDYGISKDLVAEALKSFGVKLYQNNFSTNDLYSAFLGYGAINPETTSSLPVTAYSGQEYINNYITASYDASVMPLDDVNKEVYKRLYHNLPYLAKTRGTIPGLRALINCFGIPDTILRISEFGGRDKDTSTYDYFDQKFNYAYYRTGSGANRIRTSLSLNPDWGAEYTRPESIQFRFKPDEYIDTNNTQSLMWVFDASKTSYSASVLALEYIGSGYTSASYSGSSFSSSYAYADLKFYPKPYDDYSVSASISLPFFNEDWWSIQIDRVSGSVDDTFTLYAGSKGYYDGYDGNQVLYIDSSSVNVGTTETPWNGGVTTAGNIWLGNLPAGGAGGTINNKSYIPFTGLYQELRYWAKTGSIESFKDFIMNPHSIDYEGEENEYANYLAFRAPLGSELETLVVGVGNESMHPKITGSWATTHSFTTDSSFTTFGTIITSSNIESFFYDQPIAGIKNRVTDKIQIVSSSYPTGSVLSQYRSLEQTYPSLGSETPDINLLEVAFSPQNEINNDIISSLGYFNIGEYIGDPRDVSSRDTMYPDLVNLSNNFFQKYFASYNLFDYIRLIKYFDNSLFKMIKDFVPARTSLASGLVIKQHLLERNKYPQPLVEWENVTYSGSIKSQWLWSDALSGSYLSSSLIETFSGYTGGVFDLYSPEAFGPITSFPLLESTTEIKIPSAEILAFEGPPPSNLLALSSSFFQSLPNLYNEFISYNQPQGTITTNYDGYIQFYIEGTSSYQVNANPSLDPFSEFWISFVGPNLEATIDTNNPNAFNPSLNPKAGEIKVEPGDPNFPIFFYTSSLVPCSVGDEYYLGSMAPWFASLYPSANQPSASFTIGINYIPATSVTTYSWNENNIGPTGETIIVHSSQDEFYDGELPGTELVATNGELNEANTFKYPSTYEIEYNPTLYISNITNEIAFTNPNTSPDSGEIYLWWDSGSLTNPGQTAFFQPSTYTVKTYYGGNYNAAYFAVNRTNGVKYIKANRYDINGVNQSDYLGQLETITLIYPDRVSPIIYNIVGTQEFNDYYLYSIGPYAPGSMNNFNTSSVGDINDYIVSFTTSSSPAYTLPTSLTDPVTFTNYTVTSGNTLGYFTASSGVYISGQTPNPKLSLSGYITYTAPGPPATRTLRIYLHNGTIDKDTSVFFTASLNSTSGMVAVSFNSANIDINPLFIEGIPVYISLYVTNGTVDMYGIDFSLNQSTPEFNGSSSLTLFNPYVPNYDYNDYNVVMNNAIENQVSQFFMKVDYDQSPVIPSNLTIILDNSAPRAQVQDSNYDSRAYSNIRYNGSRTNSYRVITNQ